MEGSETPGIVTVKSGVCRASDFGQFPVLNIISSVCTSVPRKCDIYFKCTAEVEIDELRPRELKLGW